MSVFIAAPSLSGYGNGFVNGMAPLPLEAPRSLLLWLASQRVASRRVDAPTPKENHHQGQQHQHQYQYGDYEPLALRVAEIQGPPEAEALWDKQRRIVGIIVKEACRPVPIIITENGASRLTISGCARFCSGTLRMPEQDKDDDNQYPTNHEESGPRHVHTSSSFKAKR
jgi:hypothetical protein